MKKKRKPRFYITVMLLQPIFFVLFFALGGFLDRRLWENAQTAPGHPAPVFSVLLPILGAVICLVVFLAAVIGLIVCLQRRRKERTVFAPFGDGSGICPRCGVPARGRFCANCGEKLEK